MLLFNFFKEFVYHYFQIHEFNKRTNNADFMHYSFLLLFFRVQWFALNHGILLNIKNNDKPLRSEIKYTIDTITLHFMENFASR